MPDPKQQAAYQKERYARDPEYRKVLKQRANQRHKAKRKAELEHWLQLQDYKCCICHGELTIETVNRDHCHVSDEYRGLLCRACNYGLGFFRDNSELLQRAVEYLRAWQD